VCRRSAGVAGLVAIVIASVACSMGGAAEPPDSGVAGVAMIGPTCGAERQPPDPNCGDRPLSGARIQARRDGRVVNEARTDVRGRFRLRLDAGRYRLYTSGGIAPFAAPVAFVRVVAHRFTRVELHVDSGIR
jgi:hypothetical protein